MTIFTTNAFSGPYLANGATVTFPFTFTAPSGEEVSVILRDTAGKEVLASGYTVMLGAGSGGSVTFLVPPASGLDVIPFLDPKFTQEIAFENGSAWRAEPVNQGYDRGALRDQALQRDVERGLKAPLGESGITLPAIAVRAGKALFFDGAGTPQPIAIDDFAAPAAAQAALAIQASDSAATSASLAAASARMFPSVADGIAASAVGEFFSVPQADSDDFAILYQRVGGSTATEITRYPSAAWVKDQFAMQTTTLTPMQFGAVGDGVADDGGALNAMFDAARALLAVNGFAAVAIVGGNKLYRTTQSLNVTNIQAWNLTVSSIYVLGACTGKAVFDLIGTRGYTFESVGVWGDKANRPAVAFQAQRGTPGGFCDNASFKECFTDGWFARAAVHDYGQETTLWDHCTIYNRSHTGRVAIHEGYSVHPMTSDYAPIMSGGTSFINKQFENCDWRYLPSDENIGFITGVTNTANAVITAPGHAFGAGDQVVFQYVAGMPQMAERIGTVLSATSDTLTVDVDTTGMGAFGGSGHIVRRATHSPIYIARTEGFSTRDCYVVSYGQPPIEVGFPDPGMQSIETFLLESILFEGSGQSSCVVFTPGPNSRIQGFTLTTYNAHAFGSLLENPNAGTVLSFYGPRIESVGANVEVPLTNNPSRFAAFGANILYANLALVAPYDWAQFTGGVVSVYNGIYSLFATLGIGDAILDGSHTGAAPAATATRYLNITLAGVPYRIKMESVA